MTAIGLLYFALSLLIVGGMFRFAEIKWPDNPLIEALAVIY
jgi:hypothetical protein